MLRHPSPTTNKETCNDEDKESMATIAKKEAREREKCMNSLRYSAVVMAIDDIQFEASGRLDSGTFSRVSQALGTFSSSSTAGARVGPGVRAHRWQDAWALL